MHTDGSCRIHVNIYMYERFELMRYHYWFESLRHQMLRTRSICHILNPLTFNLVKVILRFRGICIAIFCTHTHTQGGRWWVGEGLVRAVNRDWQNGTLKYLSCVPGILWISKDFGLFGAFPNCWVNKLATLEDTWPHATIDSSVDQSLDVLFAR